MRKTYATDLSDEEWAYLRAPTRTAQDREDACPHSLRDVFDAIFYVLRSSCPWRMLPGDFPPWSTVYYHFRRFRLSGLWHRAFAMLRAAERKRVDKYPGASTAILDSQSMRTTEEGAGSNGYDTYKNVKGRKWHLLVDTLGLPLSIYVTPADVVQDRAGARLLLAGLGPLVPRLKKIWADGAYSGKELAEWCEEQGGWELEEVVERGKEAKGFEVLPKRWIVERTLGWLRMDRRLTKNYERKAQTSETLIEVAMIRPILRRLARAV